MLANIVIVAGAMVLTGCGSFRGGADHPVFGTLDSRPEHSAREAHAGIRAAMVEFSWERFEPTAGRFDSDYIRSVAETIAALRSTDRTITLGLGIQDAPSWLLALPDSRFVDKGGKGSAEPNFVFNQVLRSAAEQYLTRLADEIDLSTIETIRLTSGANGEVLYPEGHVYWAFDRNAQNGANLPPSMPENPAPGWRPGSDGLSEAQVRQWADWYVGALANVVQWQIGVLSRLGFHGSYQVLTPGVGVLPRQYDEAVRARLPDGLLGVGAAWQVLYGALPRRPDLVAHVTSVGDGSGDDDSCQPSDRQVPPGAPVVETWSATRWISRLADEYGFRKSGENPGFHPPQSLIRSYRDRSGDGMMAAAMRQLRSCGFETFYWAHDDQLWDGTASFDHYVDHIRRTGKGA